MNRLGKRIISVLSAAAITMGMLSGCGSENEYGEDVITLRWVTYGTSVPDDLQGGDKAG